MLITGPSGVDQGLIGALLGFDQGSMGGRSGDDWGLMGCQSGVDGGLMRGPGMDIILAPLGGSGSGGGGAFFVTGHKQYKVP